jgi:hypothetical protein
MGKHHVPWTDAFLAALRDMPVLGHACDAVGIDRVTAWRRRQADPEFDAAVEDAIEKGIDTAEAEAYRRAVVGWQEPVVDKGRLAWRYRRVVGEGGEERFEPVLDDSGQPVPLTVPKRSDALLQFVLKGRRRTVYGDKQEITGAGGGPLQIDETARSARIAQLMAVAQSRKQTDVVVPDDFDLA